MPLDREANRHGNVRATFKLNSAFHWLCDLEQEHRFPGSPLPSLVKGRVYFPALVLQHQEAGGNSAQRLTNPSKGWAVNIL